MQKLRNLRSIKYGIILASAISGYFCLALWTQATWAQPDASPADKLCSEHQRFHDRDYSTPARQIVDRCEERRLGVCWL